MKTLPILPGVMGAAMVGPCPPLFRGCLNPANTNYYLT